MKLANLFLPHPKTHKKAFLISWEGIVVYILLFIFLQAGFNLLANFKPGILGISSNINQQVLIELTNKKRAEQNLPALSENSLLDQAALAKAKNMFEENYWAHFAPSGKTPWNFISSSGYVFSVAGENLARNFYTSDEVVEAWMSSPSHRDNIVNSKYKEIGIGVLNGVLNGQETTLVVQMFGTQPSVLARAPAPTPSSVAIEGKEIIVTSDEIKESARVIPQINPITVAGQQVKSSGFTIDSYLVMKNVGLGLMLMLIALLALDLYVIRRRGILRITSRHLSHMALIGVGISALFSMHPGQIL